MLDLSRHDWKPTRYPGVSICFLHQDQRSGNATVLIRMEPGSSYPAHRHRGPEELFVLQGGYRDARGVHRQGEYVRYEDGTSHHPIALTDGPACVLFAVTAEGIELLDGH